MRDPASFEPGAAGGHGAPATLLVSADAAGGSHASVQAAAVSANTVRRIGRGAIKTLTEAIEIDRAVDLRRGERGAIYGKSRRYAAPTRFTNPLMPWVVFMKTVHHPIGSPFTRLRRSTLARSGLLVLIAGVAGCAAEERRAVTVQRDSAGIRIAENLALGLAESVQWTVEASPALDVGSAEGVETETLYRVVGATRLDDGRVVIANAGTSEVRWYDADGRWLRSMGRAGGGPGEFTRMSWLLPLGGDTVAVVDGGAARVTLLDGAGAIAGEFGTSGSGILNVIGRVADGRWLAISSLNLGASLPEQGLARPDVAVLAFRAGAATFDTLGVWPGADRFVRISQSGGQITSVELTAPPFARLTRVVTHGDELYVGTQDAPEILVFGADGPLRRIVRTGAPLLPVTGELKTRFIERRIADYPPERQAASREALSTMPTGPHVPPYGTFLVDRVGRLWIQDYAALDEVVAWSVYDANGALLARVTPPVHFTPYDIGEDWMLGRETDEVGVEHVRMYEFRPAR